MISLFTKKAEDRKQGDSETRVDSITGEGLPPVNFERDTGWAASDYQEWKAAQESE